MAADGTGEFGGETDWRGHSGGTVPIEFTRRAHREQAVDVVVGEVEGRGAVGSWQRNDTVRFAVGTSPESSAFSRNHSDAGRLSPAGNICRLSSCFRVDSRHSAAWSPSDWQSPVRNRQPLETPHLMVALDISADGEFLCLGALIDQGRDVRRREAPLDPHVDTTRVGPRRPKFRFTNERYH